MNGGVKVTGILNMHTELALLAMDFLATVVSGTVITQTLEEMLMIRLHHS